MKIAITGKGGVGKTTFAATLARLYAEEGKTVLAADVDPDANLGLALGFPEELLDEIIPISKMRGDRRRRVCVPGACDAETDSQLLKPPKPGRGHYGHGGGPGASGPGNL